MSVTTLPNQTTEKSNPSKQEIDSWFAQFIDDVRVDHFMMETDSAPTETKNLYTALIEDKPEAVLRQSRRLTSKFYIEKIVVDYLNELKLSNRKPLKLAFGISDSKILVWSEIEDNDEKMEDVLLICEAKINGKYCENGFYINSTIIESSDRIPVPLHYQTIIA